MSSFTSEVIAHINSTGILAFEASGLVETLKADIASPNVASANEALAKVKALCEGIDQWIEPYLLMILPSLFPFLLYYNYVMENIEPVDKP